MSFLRLSVVILEVGQKRYTAMLQDIAYMLSMQVWAHIAAFHSHTFNLHIAT